MRVIVLLVLAGGAIVLISQNWSPVLPLVLFGGETLPLPLAVWISLATAAGMLTSVALQLLGYRPGPAQAPRVPPPRQEPRRSYREPLTPQEIRRQRDRNWESRPGADWEAPPPPEDDWNIEEPPEQPTMPRSPRERAEQAERAARERAARDRQPPQDRAPRSPEGDPEGEPERDRERDGNDENAVYDANYRIITPPPPEGDRAESPRPDEEGDWVS